MVEENNNDQFEQNDSQLASALTGKVDYLTDLQNSIKDGNDLHVYQLINHNKYNQQLDVEPDLNDNATYDFSLAQNLTPELSHHLSYKLIDYLGETYPFFYYHEYELGQFDVYFGNWWDHRLFGKLDVINVAFEFDEEEYDKLAQSFNLEAEGKRVNEAAMQRLAAENDHLTNLVVEQPDRNKQRAKLQGQMQEIEGRSAMPWESAKQKEEKQVLEEQLAEIDNLDNQANDANKKIKSNENEILKLSKEETILGFERQSIKQIFGTFAEFNDSTRTLYKNYLLSFLGNDAAEKQVSDND